MAAQNITNTTETLPVSSSLTGTVSSAADSKMLVGTNTLFLTELRVGDYVYDNTNTELREVESIQSNTELRLKVGFTNALSGATVKRVVNNATQITGAASGGDVTITKPNTDNTLTIRDGNSYTPQAKRNQIVEAFIVTAGSGVNFDYEVINR